MKIANYVGIFATKSPTLSAILHQMWWEFGASAREVERVKCENVEMLPIINVANGQSRIPNPIAAIGCRLPATDFFRVPAR